MSVPLELSPTLLWPVPLYPRPALRTDFWRWIPAQALFLRIPGADCSSLDSAYSWTPLLILYLPASQLLHVTCFCCYLQCCTITTPLPTVLFSSCSAGPQSTTTQPFYLKPSLPQTKHPFPRIASLFLYHPGNLTRTMPRHVQCCDTSSCHICMITITPSRQWWNLSSLLYILWSLCES